MHNHHSTFSSYFYNVEICRMLQVFVYAQRTPRVNEEKSMPLKIRDSAREEISTGSRIAINGCRNVCRKNDSQLTTSL